MKDSTARSDHTAWIVLAVLYAIYTRVAHLLEPVSVYRRSVMDVIFFTLLFTILAAAKLSGWEMVTWRRLFGISALAICFSLVVDNTLFRFW